MNTPATAHVHSTPDFASGAASERAVPVGISVRCRSQIATRMVGAGLLLAVGAGSGACSTSATGMRADTDATRPPQRITQRILAARDFGAGASGVLDVHAIGQRASSTQSSMSSVDASVDPALAAGVEGGPPPSDSMRGLVLASSDDVGADMPDVIARSGAPALQQAPTPVGNPVFIDGKLGDVNGNPIFASVFLDTGSATVEPVGRRLAEAARQRPLPQWRAYAREEIQKRVALFIRDEVLRAEALSTLSEDQKSGFLSFIDKLQRDTQRRLGGSRAVAERTLTQTEGVDFDQWKRREQDRQLIQLQLQERVAKRIQVSARDMEQRYDQLYDRFNQPPLATFRQVIIPANRTEQIEEFQRRLASGESFESLAKSTLNINKRESGGLEPREIKSSAREGVPATSGDRASAEFFVNPKLNEPARTMNVGDVVGPIDVTAGKAWLMLESVQQRTTDLYNAQLVLEDQIREERFNRGLDRYFARLQSRMSMTDTQTVVEELARLAEQRYYPSRK